MSILGNEITHKVALPYGDKVEWREIEKLPNGIRYRKYINGKLTNSYKLELVGGDPVIDEQVGASYDDSYSSSVTNVPTASYVRADITGPGAYYGGLRFQTVDVPNGATINVCYLSVWFYSVSYDDPDNDLDFEDIDDAADFENRKPYDMVVTGNAVTWTDTGLGASGFVNSPSLVTPCQAVVNRAGWAANQSMAVKIDADRGNSTFIVHSWNWQDHSRAPKLHIEYTTGVVYYHGLKVQGVGELALCDVGSHPLRIRKGGVTYGIELVAIDDPNASPLRIKTPAGIKAIRKYT